MGHQESPGPALPLNVDFMDSSKRLAGLMSLSGGGKPAADNGQIESKADISDAGFYKLDPMAAMANTATNFGAGIDKTKGIEELSNKLNSIEEDDLKRSGLDINVTPQISMTNR